ncbi:hypothetical protein SI65_01262 [Aspergillus cristatus]|uniref:Uncharacterized protein n=1 Tax=Aspergillus cristatus TaxID=573508 RepID=A0A1E3BRS4_ASPCR|nr:hypothetical protein SI65_01262 [Aspergillus cristatus]
MDTSKPILFYDIASGPPATCFAPNPWKTRYALNFKGVNYQTEWVELPDVTGVRKRLGAPPNRTHRDGSAFYTLPVIHDLSTGDIVGDSLEIAQYLDKTYPDGPSLFPHGSTVSHDAKGLNILVDTLFTQHVVLFIHGMPLNPATAKASKATFCERAGVDDWEKLTVRGEERAKVLNSFKQALGNLADLYKKNTEGPFLEGATPSYADLIVGAWLSFAKATSKEWEDIQTWHNGIFGKLHQALEKYAEIN